MFKSKFKKSIEKRAVDMFGITGDVHNIGYILRNGAYLKHEPFIGRAGRKEFAHVRVMSVFTPEEKEMKGGSEVNKFLNWTGSIRAQVRDDTSAFEVRKKLSKEQINSIRLASEGKKIYIDYTDGKGNTIKSGSFNSFPKFVKWAYENKIVLEKG